MAGRPLHLVIHGHNFPGHNFRNAGVPIHGVHVGVQVGRPACDLVSGDAASATWNVDVRLTPTDGSFDFHGPAVHGRRGERFLYLTWGDVTVDSDFTMFRRAKLMLATIEPSLLEAARSGPGGAHHDRSDRRPRLPPLRPGRAGLVAQLILRPRQQVCVKTLVDCRPMS